ncbi:MAG: low temperature requirement protein, partial [Pseudonocardiales bacterium]|nr:low temperature requirement protein [Pseudonocardiales bacterium]
AVTIGYLIMRLAMVGQWLRAAHGDPEHRATCLRYAAGITVVQVGWLARLALPDHLGLASFVVLALADVTVPVLAERTGMTTWHPDHIAERYGLFTIIVLGECVTQAANAMQVAYTESGVSLKLVVTAALGLILLFALWWLYFVVPQGEGLRARRDRSFAWGYGHLVIFSSLAAVAAGLEVALESLTHHVEIPAIGVALTVAVPVAVFMVVQGAIVRVLGDTGELSLPLILVGAIATVAAGFTARWWSTPVVGFLVTLPAVLLVSHAVWVSHRRAVAIATG